MSVAWPWRGLDNAIGRSLSPPERSGMDDKKLSGLAVLSRSEARRGGTQLRRIRRMSWILDAAWRIPGTRFRVGFDTLIGLIPGFGDLLGGGLSVYLIFQASRMGVRKRALARMIINAVTEILIGSIPILGDVFDAVFKANLRNLRILENDLKEGTTIASSLDRIGGN